MSEEARISRRNRIEQFLFIKIPYVVSGILFLVAAAINIANIVARYVFFKPIFWAEEILIFLMIWGVYVAVITITYRGAHLSMDLIYSTLKPWMKVVVNIAITIAFLGSTIFTVLQSWKVVLLHIRMHGVTAGTDIPLVIPHTAVLVGFALMAVTVLVRLRVYLTGRFD
jgi:TRAP-type C4-dicarboxylate transport system permease small subunit